MNRVAAIAAIAAYALATLATMLVPTPAQACGEGQFNMGRGMGYQGYLAARPATVLVYDEHPEQRRSIYLGLHRAGHRLAVARNSEELSRLTRGRRFDVMISSLDRAAILKAPGARLLPVVKRQERNDASLRSRFQVFLLDGASVGQYLKGIDKLVRGGTR